MTDKEWHECDPKEWFEYLTKKSLELMKRDGHHTPMCFVMKNGDMGICPIEPDGDDSPLDYLKPIVAKLQPEAYLFICEFWSKMMTKEQTDEHIQSGKKVVEYAEKTEGLALIGGTMDGKITIRDLYHVKRDSANKVVDLKKYEGGIFKSSKVI